MCTGSIDLHSTTLPRLKPPGPIYELTRTVQTSGAISVSSRLCRLDGGASCTGSIFSLLQHRIAASGVGHADACGSAFRMKTGGCYDMDGVVFARCRTNTAVGFNGGSRADGWLALGRPRRDRYAAQKQERSRCSSISLGQDKICPNDGGKLRILGLTIARECSIVLGLIFVSLTGCGSGDEQGPMISTSPTPTPVGSTVSLVWDPVNDSTIIGYYIHYGKQSPNQPGSCAYHHGTFVSSPQGTVTGLDPGSTYYFAVSAYNGVRGDCSNEVEAQT